MSATVEMPKYQCHKLKWALKIKSIDFNAEDGLEYLTPEDPKYSPIPITIEWEMKHNPEDGGYYVVYEDGYASFSPAEAFESGHTLII